MSANKNPQVIVIGGGLSGLSAAHTVLQNGFSVVLIERNLFCGGNSTKATSGINGALTKVQDKKGIKDSMESFLRDTAISASKGKSDVPHELAKVLVENSAPAVHWLIDSYTLMKFFDEITSKNDGRARLLTKSRATNLIFKDKKVIGVEYVDRNGKTLKEYGPVIIATGGFAADFSKDGILSNVRPDLLHLPTTNGPHCTGDGIKMAQAIGGASVDLAHVQVHPTGLINPAEPDSKTLYLAAEALRGCGALMLDKDGERFADELGRRDYVSGEMFKRNKQPYRLILNGKASREIDWHCKHYTARGLMKHFETGSKLAEEMGISVSKLEKTFSEYNVNAQNKKDPFGKKFFANTPFEVEDYFYAAIVTPVIHYCMGGIAVSTDSCVVDSNNKKIPGLFASGEVIGGVHGVNRLGGSSLLDCVVFGRLAGDSSVEYLRSEAPKSTSITKDSSFLDISIKSGDKVIDISVRDANKNQTDSEKSVEVVEKEEEKEDEKKETIYTMEEVAKHNTEDDCWVVVNGAVLDATSFLDDHPGGKKVIMIYAGKDASEEFNMVHEPDVVETQAPQIIIGKLLEVKDTSKL